MTAPPHRPLQQSGEFRRALSAAGHPARRLTDGSLALCRRLPGGFRLAMLARARIASPNRLYGWLKAAGLGSTPVILSPDHPVEGLGRLGALQLLTAAHVAEICLRPDPARLRAGLRQKWRNRLVRAEAHGLRTTDTPLPDDPGHWLLQADSQQQFRRGYRGWPAPLTLAYARTSPGRARLFTAFTRDEPVAAMLFLIHGRAATYHIGHITALGRGLSAHNLLLWQAVTTLRREGILRLDLGQVDTRNAPGLARFKLGTGATVRQLGGTWLWWPPLGRLLRAPAEPDEAPSVLDRGPGP